MKNNQKRKHIHIIAFFCSLSVIAIIVTGGIMAFFVDTDKTQNTFTIGSVQIQLEEPNWESATDTVNNLRIGQEIRRDPRVKNIGKNDAYIYMKVTVPTGAYTDQGTTTTNVQLFTYTINEATNSNEKGWKELTQARNNDGKNNIYVYYYNIPLPAQQGSESTTISLFNKVKFVEIPNIDSFKSETLNMKIESYAIQADGLPANTQVTNTELAEQFKQNAAGLLIQQ